MVIQTTCLVSFADKQCVPSLHTSTRFHTDGNFLSNSEHRLSETGNAKLSILFLHENSQERLFYTNEITVFWGNSKTDTPTDSLFRAGLMNAAFSSMLNMNVWKITQRHTPQPVSQSTSHYKTSLDPKSLQHFKILPAMGEGRGNEEESGRKKEMAASPSQPCTSLKALNIE